MAEIQISPNPTSLSAEGEIDLLYEAVDFSDNTSTISFPLAIFYNSSEVPLDAAEISNLPGDTSIVTDSTQADENDGDNSSETDTLRFLNLDNLPVDFSGEQTLLTFPTTLTESFDGSVVNFAFAGNPDTAGFDVSEIEGVTLEGGDVGGDDITVALSINPAEGTEADGTTFTLTAETSEAVTGEQTVDLALSGDADAEDFVGDLPAAITIADGQTTGTVEVTVNDDDVEEGEETANFALENPPEGFVLGANTNVDITIEDNDAPPAELQGDFNDDGITNLDDLGLFAAAFGSSEGNANYNPAVELTGDTLINNNDLDELRNIFADEFVA